MTYMWHVPHGWNGGGSKEDVAPTITISAWQSNHMIVEGNKVEKDMENDAVDIRNFDKKIRIRKLTPRECWRLMGVRDGDIDKVSDGSISNAQLYKMAGNSIVVDVMARMFDNLLFPVRENGSLF